MEGNEKINVAETLGVQKETPTTTANTPLIHGQRINADAAYQRLKTLRSIRNQLDTEINATDVANMPDNMKAIYADLNEKFFTLMVFEQMLIQEGE